MGNENGFVDIGEYSNGSVMTIGEYIPEWLSDFKKYMEERQ